MRLEGWVMGGQHPSSCSLRPLLRMRPQKATASSATKRGFDRLQGGFGLGTVGAAGLCHIGAAVIGFWKSLTEPFA